MDAAARVPLKLWSSANLLDRTSRSGGRGSLHQRSSRLATAIPSTLICADLYQRTKASECVPGRVSSARSHRPGQGFESSLRIQWLFCSGRSALGWIHSVEESIRIVDHGDRRG